MTEGINAYVSIQCKPMQNGGIPINTLISIVFIGFLIYLSYVDIKKRELEEWMWITAYAIALLRSVINNQSLLNTLISTLGLFTFLFILEVVHRLVHGANSMGIGGADIKLALALGLYTGYYVPVFLIISFGTALIIETLIRKNKRFPLVPYFTVGIVSISILNYFN